MVRTPAGPNGGPDSNLNRRPIYVELHPATSTRILVELRAKAPQSSKSSPAPPAADASISASSAYTDEVWPSDNTDALDRLTIQDGFTHAYSPNIMVAWVTDVPNFLDRRTVPLSFRFLVAMTGSLGIGNNLNKWTPEDFATATRMTTFYKQVRNTVQLGSLYRLIRPSVGDQPSEQSAVEYVAEDGKQAVVYGFLHSQQFGNPFPTLHLEGLDPTALYKLTPLDSAKARGLPAQLSGAQLMGEGLQLTLVGDYDATAILLERSAP